jgi:transcriptional regulator with XRE-family HTH domain
LDGGGIRVFGKRLNQLRDKLGLTQKELSSRLGIPRTTYSGYENGSREPDHQTMEKFANYFDVSIDYLLGRTEDPKRVLKEQARQLIDMVDLELTDEEIMEKMDFYVDGMKVEKEEVIIFINLIRANRIRAKLDLSPASPENKK